MMEDIIMCFVGICLGLLCLAFAGSLLTITIRGTEPTKAIEIEVK